MSTRRFELEIRFRIGRGAWGKHGVLSLAPGEYLVGSNPDCTIRLRFPTVSRKHAVLHLEACGAVLWTDLGSRNGSWIRRARPERLKSDEAQPWLQEQDLFVGPFALRWREKKAETKEPIGGDAPSVAWRRRYRQLLQTRGAEAHEALRQELGETPNFGEAARDAVLEEVHHEFHGDGPLRGLLEDPRCKELLLNSAEEIFADIGRGLEKTGLCFSGPEAFEAWAVRKANACGRRLDLQNPICEASLPDGARFHAVLQPLSHRGLSVAIRRLVAAPITEEQALETGWMSAKALHTLRQSILQKENIVISGGTSTGKTSLLNFLCRYVPPGERLITIEDTVELSPPVENLVQLQARKPNADGVGEVTLRELVKCALRMRPDRIVVGECRGAEVLEMLQALNTGHPGSLTTVHANSTREALQRLELLALLGAPNLSLEALRAWTASSIHVLVQVERSREGQRFVRSIERQTEHGLETLYSEMGPDRA